MDKFLQEQQAGPLVDRGNEFTISREKARDKTLRSAPEVPLETVYRLIDASLINLGYKISDCVTYRRANDYRAETFEVDLPNLGTEKCIAIVGELRAPFGADPGPRRLAQALILAAVAGCKVNVTFRTGAILGGQKTLCLEAESLSIPEDFDVSSAQSILIDRAPISYTFPSHRDSPNRWMINFLDTPERVIPMSSLSHSVHGFFDGRVKPFTAIRSYAYISDDASEAQGMQVDLWTGPYRSLDPSTAVVDKREPGGFLIFRWKPDYGNPTLVHHSLDSPLVYGVRKCQASFMVRPSEEPARVHFFSSGIVSDPIAVPGPRGLVGMVVWPGFRYDLWGTRPVQDKVYEEAMAWTAKQIDATAARLSEYLEEVIDRVCKSRLLKANYYADEVAARMRQMWSATPPPQTPQRPGKPLPYPQ